MARRVSYCLTSGVVAPSGKPTTEHTPTPVPRSSRAQNATQVGLTHTVAKLKLGRLATQLLDLRGGRVRLEQRVIDERRDLAAPPPAAAGRAATPGRQHAADLCGQQSKAKPWQAQRDGATAPAAASSCRMMSMTRLISDTRSGRLGARQT